ncbi:hypothetical protein CB1_002727002, partial [Camelus ferus]
MSDVQIPDFEPDKIRDTSALGRDDLNVMMKYNLRANSGDGFVTAYFILFSSTAVVEKSHRGHLSDRKENNTLSVKAFIRIPYGAYELIGVCAPFTCSNLEEHFGGDTTVPTLMANTAYEGKVILIFLCSGALMVDGTQPKLGKWKTYGS